MSALYSMQYVGHEGLGAGALYIGRGVVVGIDTGNVRYSGKYTEVNGGINAEVMMKAPATGATLVTGKVLVSGQPLLLKADWPKNFADGVPQTILVGGHQVQVRLEKIGDIP